MKTRRHLIGLVMIGAAAMFGLAGCYGPAPALDPVVTLEFNREANWPNIEAGTIFFIEGKGTTSDGTANPITASRWTQSPAIGHFLVESPNSLTNTWRAPVSVATPTPVDLTLTTKTLQGGENVTTVRLIVVPSGTFPRYDFDYAAMTADAPTFPNVKQGTMLRLAGVGWVAPPDFVRTYAWTMEPNLGVIDHPYEPNPMWTAPVLRIDATTGLPIPETIKIHVRVRSEAGYESTSSMLLNVVP